MGPALKRLGHWHQDVLAEVCPVKMNKVLSFVVMDYGLCYVSKDLCISQICYYEIMSVFMSEKQQTDDLYA